MKTLLIFSSIAVIATAGLGIQRATGSPDGSCCGDSDAAACSGSTPCKVCTNCSRCGHCKAGGTCGTCK